MLANPAIWETVDAENEVIIKKLYVKENATGLRAIRLLGTYLGLIIFLSLYPEGVGKALNVLAVVVVFNVFMYCYTKWDADKFTASKLFVAQGVCVETKVVTKQEDTFNDGDTRTFTHYYVTFALKDGEKYCINLSESYFVKLSIGDIFTFIKPAVAGGKLSYYSQWEIDWLKRALKSSNEEIKANWLAAEGWQKAEGKFRKTLLANCKIKNKIESAWLFGGSVAIVFTAFFIYCAWNLDSVKFVTTTLLLLMTFGFVGVSLLWSSVISFWENIRMSFGPVYYCNGKCTELALNGNAQYIAYIELANGLKFAVPLSEKNRANVGSIRCVNTNLSYKYKNKYIGKAKRFDFAWYEKQLFFISYSKGS